MVNREWRMGRRGCAAEGAGFIPGAASQRRLAWKASIQYEMVVDALHGSRLVGRIDLARPDIDQVLSADVVSGSDFA